MRVKGEGPKPARVMFVGEAPGREEDMRGRPFIGAAGKELDRFLESIELNRAECYVTNLVKERPPNNRDPYQEEIDRDEGELQNELDDVQPEIVVTLGRISTRWALGEVDMETVHGIPQQPLLRKFIVHPCYHPAAGLHSPDIQAYLQYDFEQLRLLLDGKIPAYPPEDEHPQPDYREIPDGMSTMHRFVREALHGRTMAIDTEGLKGRVWGLSYSTKPGHARVVKAIDGNGLRFVQQAIEEVDLIVFHNILHDLSILREMDIHVPISKCVDTMVMAYLLCLEPQGLKPLARRHCGMEMHSYLEVIREADERIARTYLQQAFDRKKCPKCEGVGLLLKPGKKKVREVRCETCDGDGTLWPKPEPVLIMEGGRAREYQAQSIGRRLRRQLEPEDGGGLRAWWDAQEIEVKAPIVAALGPMPETSLDDVTPPETAIQYSARDADATLRVHSKLSPKIAAMDLDRVLQMDMGIIPMVDRMQETGWLIDTPYFDGLTSEFETRMQHLQRQLNRLAGGYVNPASSKQVGDLLFRRLELPVLKMTKSKSQESTDDKTLEALRLQIPPADEQSHLILDTILEYRELSKLAGTYTRPLPLLADRAGRVHPNLRITRTASGRLSCVGGSTELPTSRGLIPIDSYIPQPDDFVLSHTGTPRRVMRKIYKGLDHMFRVRLSTGKAIECTGSHRFLTPTGWAYLAELVVGSEVISHECVEEILNSLEHPTDTASVLRRREANSSSYSSDRGHDLSHRTVHRGDTPAARAVSDGESSPVFTVEARPEQPYVGQEWRPAPRLEERCLGQQRISDAHCGWETLLRASDRLRACLGHSSFPAAGVVGSASHRRESPEQQTGQPSTNDQSWAQNHSCGPVAISEITYVGEMAVWDIEVEEDHSYLAHGFFNHNSFDPNLQNIPIRPKHGRDNGKRIRQGFICRPGFRLGSWDLSQIEMRILAHESKDPNLLRLYVEGQYCPKRDEHGKCDCHDMHRYTASLIYRVPIEEVTPAQRMLAKNIGFGIVYGITAKGLKAQMDLRGEVWTEEQCQAMIDAYLDVAYPGVRDFMDEKAAEARRYGYVRDMFGRVRYLPAVHSTAQHVAQEALRQAGNHPIQAGAQGVIKLAMRRVWDSVLPALWAEGFEVQPLMQIHDELVLEFEEGLEEVLDGMMKRAFAEAVELRVPIESSGAWGQHWAELKD